MIDKQQKASAVKEDIAVTLMGRDYKGINNYGSNGVIEECQQKKN